MTRIRNAVRAVFLLVALAAVVIAVIFQPVTAAVLTSSPREVPFTGAAKVVLVCLVGAVLSLVGVVLFSPKAPTLADQTDNQTR